jgi:pilus assembly protein Flp/PilA
MRQLLARIVTEDSGQDLIEYALLAAILTLSTAAVVRNFKNNVTNIFVTIGNVLTSAVS